jgi:hypothetical protein
MTIHVDDIFAEALRSRARDMGISVNKAVKEMLSPMLGLAKVEVPESDNPFMKFCGILPKGEGARLRASVAAQRTIDKEMWE